MSRLTEGTGIGLVVFLTASIMGCGDSEADGNGTEQVASETELSAEDEQVLQDWLDEMADLERIVDPPKVERVRLVSRAEYPQVQVDCLREHGLDASLTHDGQGTEVNSTQDQEESDNLAAFTCAAQYPIHPDQLRPHTTEQKEIVFEYLTGTLVECLDGFDHSVTDIPSRETFLANYDETPPWNPYEQIVLETATEWEETTRECPVNTPPEIIYGE